MDLEKSKVSSESRWLGNGKSRVLLLLEAERDTSGQIELPFSGLLSKCLEQLGLGQTQAGSQKLTLGPLVNGMARTQLPESLLLHCRVPMDRKLENWEPGIEPRHCDMELRC